MCFGKIYNSCILLSTVKIMLQIRIISFTFSFPFLVYSTKNIFQMWNRYQDNNLLTCAYLCRDIYWNVFVCPIIHRDVYWYVSISCKLQWFGTYVDMFLRMLHFNKMYINTLILIMCPSVRVWVERERISWLTRWSVRLLTRAPSTSPPSCCTYDSSASLSCRLRWDHGQAQASLFCHVK